jgi:hypothetical protein
MKRNYAGRLIILDESQGFCRDKDVFFVAFAKPSRTFVLKLLTAKNAKSLRKDSEEDQQGT